MIVSGASLDLYCDNETGDYDHDVHNRPIQYFHPERTSACRRMARRDGWFLDEEHTLCPACAKAHRGTSEKRD